MNLLPDDLKTEVYIYLPLNQFLSLIPNPSENRWISRANLEVGKNVRDQFLKISGNNKDRYLLTLALHNIVVPGSEKFVSEVQMMQYAKDHENKNLAEYITSKTKNLNDESVNYISLIMTLTPLD